MINSLNCIVLLVHISDNITKDIVGLDMDMGLDPGTFREILYEIVNGRELIRNKHEVVGAMEFEYTFWAKPDNKTAVRQNLVDVSIGHLYFRL